MGTFFSQNGWTGRSAAVTESSLSSIVCAVTTVLCRVGPLSLDGPSTKALMVGIVASEVAVLDETTNGMTTAVVDVLVLAHDFASDCRLSVSILKRIEAIYRYCSLHEIEV